MLALKNISHTYPNTKFQLTIDTIEVEAGNNLAIIGPSGCGKTTLLNIISGIIRPNNGEINIANIPVHQLSSTQIRAWRMAHIGFVFQDFRLFEYLTVLDNIVLPFMLANNGITFKEKMERVDHFAEYLNITSLLKKHPKHLSQGEKQRVAIARALITKPKIILADEPTGNLDPDNKQIILDLLLNCSKKEKAILIAVTHDYDLLPSFNNVFNFKTMQL